MSEISTPNSPWRQITIGTSEKFGGHYGHLLRRADYGNQWIRTPDGQWAELTTARFSHDPAGREDRFDRFRGLENGEFFLSHAASSMATLNTAFPSSVQQYEILLRIWNYRPLSKSSSPHGKCLKNSSKQ